MSTRKYGVTYTNSAGNTVFKWFLGKVDVYDALFALLGLDTTISAAASSDHRKTSHDPDFCRIAVKLVLPSGLSAGRRLVYVARDEVEEVLGGSLNGLPWGLGAETIESAYVPRNLAYS